MSAEKPRRLSVRCKHASDWQSRMREECLLQVQQQRVQLLDRFRERRGSEDLAGLLSAVAAGTKRGCAVDPGDAIRRLSRAEHEELLAEMEAVLFDENIVDELEDVEADDLNLVSSMFAAQSLSTPAVRCPVCEAADLTESAFGAVVCPREGFRIEAAAEGGGGGETLASVRDGIAAKLEEHRLGGCPEKPQFFVRETGGGTLYLACYTCGALEVVL